MNEVLEPLVMIPGVRMAAIVSEDGVPICVLKGRPRGTGEQPDASDAADSDAFVGLSTGWFAEVTGTLGQLAWDQPTRIVLCATRGAMVLQRAEGASLAVVLEHGVSPEELRVPMEGATARMQRHVRGMRQPTPPLPAPTPAPVPAPAPAPVQGALPASPVACEPSNQRSEPSPEA